MKRSRWSLAIGAVFPLILVASACNPDNKVTPGAPVLVKFAVVTPAGAAVDLGSDGGAPVPAPPLSYAYALFDRILDPTPLALLGPDGGITDKDGVAKVEWSGGIVPATTLYFPNGSAKWTLIPVAFGVPFGVGPSIAVTPTLGLPSGVAITVTLSPEKVRSHDQKDPFQASADVTSPLVFQTEPLSVTIDVPVAPAPDGGADSDDAGSADDGGSAGPPPAATDYVVHIAFNNLTSDDTAGAIRTVVTTAAGTVVDFAPVVARDPQSPAGWTVSPPSEGWPAGATVTVTVAADAADNFQIALGAPMSATFTVQQ